MHDHFRDIHVDLRVIFSYVLGKYLGMGVFGVWVAMIIDWLDGNSVLCSGIAAENGSTMPFLKNDARMRAGKWKIACQSGFLLYMEEI